MTEHDKLLNNLANILGTPYRDINLGSMYLSMYDKYYNGGKAGVPRADIVRVNPSFTRFLLDIFEVKATRADLLQDIKKDKYKKYLPYCNRLYFAIPRGMCKRDEIPDQAGIYQYNEDKKTWTCIRAAEKRSIDWGKNVEILMGVIFYRQKTEKHREFINRNCGGKLKYIGYHNLKKIGKDVAKAVLHYRDCPMKDEEIRIIKKITEILPKVGITEAMEALKVLPKVGITEAMEALRALNEKA